jgi:D-alanyl-lipoteichoic acid acyltransferase DltB (MBOAT superfamily)
MTFLSISWLAWMLGAIALYWLLPARLRDYFLVLATALFIICSDWLSALLLAALTLGTYVAANRSRTTTGQVIIAALAVIAVLAAFKLRVKTAPLDAIRNVAMPLGLSYYAFRIVHYLIEKARGTLAPHTFRDYVSYLFFLPTIVVGPIHRFPAFLQDRAAMTWRAEYLSAGMERILFGYFKIVVLGNFLLSKYLALRIGSMDKSHRPLVLYLEAVRGSLNLYCQFSGYSDIAIGFGLMIGYRVMENFDSPFLKRNVAEFWRSWHMSLTQWSRDYLYLPMVGATRQPVYGTLVSLVFIGVWHELSFRYVVWGLYHGLGIIAVNQMQGFLRRRRVPRVRHPVLKRVSFLSGAFLTANYFFLGYVIINQQSLSDTLKVYQLMLFSWL